MSKVEEQYAGWLAQQCQSGLPFTEQQRWWLDRIADVIATSAGVTADDLDNALSWSGAALMEPSAISAPRRLTTSNNSTRN